MMRTTSGSLFDLAPGGVYKLSRSPVRLVVSYTTLSALLGICVSKFISGLLSVALSISLRIPPVRRHLVLRCSDFPPQHFVRVTIRPTQLFFFGCSSSQNKNRPHTSQLYNLEFSLTENTICGGIAEPQPSHAPSPTVTTANPFFAFRMRS